MVNPFDPNLVQQMQLVVLLRIYDAICAVLNETNEDMASALHKAHEQGEFIGSLPGIPEAALETNKLGYPN